MLYFSSQLTTNTTSTVADALPKGGCSDVARIARTETTQMLSRYLSNLVHCRAPWLSAVMETETSSSLYAVIQAQLHLDSLASLLTFGIQRLSNAASLPLLVSIIYMYRHPQPLCVSLSLSLQPLATLASLIRAMPKTPPYYMRCPCR
jgi:hypothetical protein